MAFLTDAERVTLAAVITLVQPEGVQAGAIDYVEQLLTAFEHEPPRIWLDGPWHTPGQPPRWMALGRLEEIAWRRRIEAWQETYRTHLAGLAGVEVTDEGVPDDFKELVFEHACEGIYAHPHYGGNTDEQGWTTAGYEGEVLPRGWLPLEVSDPTGRGSLR